MIELYIMLVFMIVAAIAAVRAKDLFFSVIAMGTVGLGLSVTFMILKAPDIAITQLVMEIIILIVLIRATIRKDIEEPDTAAFLSSLAVGLFIVGFLAVAWFALKDLPQFGHPLMRVSNNYLLQGMNRTGAVNMVSSVTMDFRSYDTLAEAAMLFVAVIGVISIVRNIGKKNKNEQVADEDE